MNIERRGRRYLALLALCGLLAALLALVERAP